MAKRYLVASSGAEVPGGKATLSVRRWEADKAKKLGRPLQGLRNHVATDVSWLGVSGKRSACGLHHEEEMVPMHGMCGPLNAELEAQRTILELS